MDTKCSVNRDFECIILQIQTMVLTQYVSKVIMNTYCLKVKMKVKSNISKDIIIWHVNSIHLLTDNVCLKELKPNKTTA